MSLSYRMNAPEVDAAAIERAAEILRQGGIVALPTETVYGLAADASNADAVRRLFAAKGRPADHPVIVHVSGEEALAEWATGVPDIARVLARTFWPGPLTLVLKRGSSVSDVVTGGQNTVGLRAPAHPWARAVLHAFGGALAAPSANSFGRVSPTTAQHVIDDLGVKPRGKVDMILNGGACPVGIESTIVDVSSNGATLLRLGSITREQLQHAIGGRVTDAEADAPRAPGRLERHYSPHTPLSVMQSSELAEQLAKPGGERLAVLAPLSLLEGCLADVALAIAAASDPADYARLLYSSLHRLDASGADRMLVAAPPDGPRWEAVRDRLRRAETAKTA